MCSYMADAAFVPLCIYYSRRNCIFTYNNGRKFSTCQFWYLCLCWKNLTIKLYIVQYPNIFMQNCALTLICQPLKVTYVQMWINLYKKERFFSMTLKLVYFFWSYEKISWYFLKTGFCVFTESCFTYSELIYFFISI